MEQRPGNVVELPDVSGWPRRAAEAQTTSSCLNVDLEVLNPSARKLVWQLSRLSTTRRMGELSSCRVVFELIELWVTW